jgi:tetratricopeptide (TPR) repeat protein
LDALEKVKPVTLQEFITYLEKDMVMKHFVAKAYDPSIPLEARMMVAEVTAPLNLAESKSYRQLIFSENEPFTQRLFQSFNIALENDKKGQKKDAIEMLTAYLKSCPTDGEAYGSLANILADLRDFDASFFAYQKALELLPYDPFITRNYSIALRESGKWFESLKLILQLYEQFPMLGDVRKICEDDLKQVHRKRLAKSE